MPRIKHGRNTDGFHDLRGEELGRTPTSRNGHFNQSLNVFRRSAPRLPRFQFVATEKDLTTSPSGVAR